MDGVFHLLAGRVPDGATGEGHFYPFLKFYVLLEIFPHTHLIEDTVNRNTSASVVLTSAQQI